MIYPGNQQMPLTMHNREGSPMLLKWCSLTLAFVALIGLSEVRGQEAKSLTVEQAQANLVKAQKELAVAQAEQAWKDGKDKADEAMQKLKVAIETGVADTKPFVDDAQAKSKTLT